MFAVGFDFFIMAALLFGLGMVFGLWVYYDRRDRHLFDQVRALAAFHCTKCGTVYSGQSEKQESCPQCGHGNYQLKF